MYSISALQMHLVPAGSGRLASIIAMVLLTQTIAQAGRTFFLPFVHPVAVEQSWLPERAEMAQGMVGGQERASRADLVDDLQRQGFGIQSDIPA